MMQHFKQNAWFVLILGLGLVAARDCFSLVETHTGHNWWYTGFRFSAMADALRTGEDYRWIRSLAYGWGYPLFYFTAPLPYLIGALFLLIDLSIVPAVNLFWITATFTTAILGFLAGRRLFGSWGGLLFSAALTLGPYRLVDVFVRTNSGETLVLALLPLLIYSVCKPSPSKWDLTLGAIGVAGVVLSHILSLLLVGLGMSIFCLGLILLHPKCYRKRILLNFAFIALIGLGLTSFFWLPAVIDSEAVWGKKALIGGYFTQDKHYLRLRDLVSLQWDYGFSPPRNGGQEMPFTLSPLILTVSLFCFMLSILKFKTLRERAELEHRVSLAAGFTSLGAMFLTLEVSELIWSAIPALQILQFPWRFHLVSTWSLALLLACLPTLVSALFPNRATVRPIAALLVLVPLVLIHFPFTKAGGKSSVPFADEHPSIIAQKGITTTLGGEFYPEHVRNAPKIENLVRVYFEVEPSNVKHQFHEQLVKNGWAKASLTLSEPATLVFNQFWFPAWKVKKHNKTIMPERLADELSRMAVHLEPGSQTLEFYLGHTRAGKLGVFISQLSLMGLFIFLLRDKFLGIIKIGRSS